ncbi:small adipocyte factor 1 [Homo sapiens]
MTPVCAWIGSPGAKAQLSFAGRGHSTAKRRRGPAGEPAVPGEALPGARGSLKAHPKPWAAAMWARGCLHHIRVWFSWSQQGSGNGRSGWERLAREARGLWQLWCLPGTPNSSPLQTDM